MIGVLLFFFFQAEDGIRDKLVTGVQTCALPISVADLGLEEPDDAGLALGALGAVADAEARVGVEVGLRSEEHTSELQSLAYLVCRLLLEKKKTRVRDACRLRASPVAIQCL